MGDSDISASLYGATTGEYRARAALLYGYAAADRVYEGDHEIKNALARRLKMHMALLSASLEAPFGTGLAVLLPFAALDYDDWQSDKGYKKPIRDKGIGDIELRLRQDFTTLLGLRDLPHVVLSLGTAMPTGSFTADTTTEMSIGRGAWWTIGELEVFGNLPLGFGYSVMGGARKALNYAPDDAPTDLGWGNEYRASAGLRYGYELPKVDGTLGLFVPSRVMAAASGEYLHRDQSTLPDPNDLVRKVFKDSGGNYINVTPTLLLAMGDILSLTVSARIPVSRDVQGIQPVQSTSYFLGLSGQFAMGGAKTHAPQLQAAQVGAPPAQPEIRAMLAPGQVTLVDYWATWCEPCKKLGVELEALVQTRADVALRRVDATDWDKASWERLLPDASGLPVLDVYGADGKLIARLIGEAAFDYPRLLPAAPAPAAAPAAP